MSLIKPLKISISASIGEVSAELYSPGTMKYIMTIAHGAGAGMNHPFMASLAEALGNLQIGTLRFNFPFTENRKGRPDVPVVAHKTIEAAIEKAHDLFPSLPLFAAGKSFGGRMTSQYLSKNSPAHVKGIVFFGFPLHAPGKLSVDRANHLGDIKIPMLFLQGTRDVLAKWELIESVCSTLLRADLVKMEGADHGFKVSRKNIIPDLAVAADEWIRRQDLSA